MDTNLMWVAQLLGVTVDDVDNLDSWICESCIDEEKFVEFVQEQAKELEKCVWDMDLYALLLEFIIVEADIPELIPYLYNHGRHSTIKISPSSAGKIMIQVSEEDRNESWFFILDIIEVELPNENETER